MNSETENKVKTNEDNSVAKITVYSIFIFLCHSFGFALIVIGINLLIFKERLLGIAASEIEKYVNEAYILPDDEIVRNQYDRDVVFLNSIKPHPSYGLREEEFDLSFGKQLHVRRITEYCQWNEFKSPTGEVSYEKGWYSHLISSDGFVESESHQNSRRDPFPSHLSTARRILIGSFVVDPPFFANVTTYPHRYEASSFSTEYVPLSTKKEGFLFVSNAWFYSKINMAGSSDKVNHANMTYLSETEEARFEEHCDAGDLRVGFATESLPVEVTIIAQQNDYRLMPMRVDGHPIYILFDHHLNPDEILTTIEKKEGLQLQWYRVICGLLVCIGMLCRYQDTWPFTNLPYILRCMSCAVLSPMLTTLAMRAYYYGVTDTNFYRMALYLVLPLLLVLSLDMLFKLINMYRVGLMILKEKEKEKEKEKKEN